MSWECEEGRENAEAPGVEASGAVYERISHVHAIVKAEETRTISDVLQSFGSFAAHAILERLRSEKRYDLLACFAQRQGRDAANRHWVWQPIHPKNIYSVAFLRERWEYTHNNSVAKH